MVDDEFLARERWLMRLTLLLLGAKTWILSSSYLVSNAEDMFDDSAQGRGQGDDDDEDDDETWVEREELLSMCERSLDELRGVS
jgi:hypothetical protein